MTPTRCCCSQQENGVDRYFCILQVCDGEVDLGLRLRVTFDLQVDVPVDLVCHSNRMRQRQTRSAIGVGMILQERTSTTSLQMLNSAHVRRRLILYYSSALLIDWKRYRSKLGRLCRYTFPFKRQFQVN